MVGLERCSEVDSTGHGRIRKSLKEGKAKSDCQAYGFSNWGAEPPLT